MILSLAYFRFRDFVFVVIKAWLNSPGDPLIEEALTQPNVVEAMLEVLFSVLVLKEADAIDIFKSMIIMFHCISMLCYKLLSVDVKKCYI